MAEILSKIVNPKTKLRSSYWDNIKGVLIILVVFAHCLYNFQDKPINNLIVDAIYYFHMPAFIFVSGFFSKSEKCRSRESILYLLMAYLFFMIPFIFYRSLNDMTVKLIHPYYSAWYLLALAILRLIAPYLAKFRHILPATVIFSVLVGFWGTINGESALAINKAVTFLPFFMAGYLTDKEFIDNKIKQRKALPKLSAGVVAFALAFVLEIISYKALNVTTRDLLPNKYAAFDFIEPLTRMAVMAVASLFILSFLLLSVDKKIPILTMAGRNSMSIFLFHRIFTLIFAHYLAGYRAKIQIAAAIICTLLIIAVFGNDFVSKNVNAFIRNCARSISFTSQQETKKEKVYKAITLSIICITFIAPIVIKFIRLSA